MPLQRYRPPHVLWAFALLLWLLMRTHSVGAASEPTINNVRLWHSPSETRIVFDASADLSHKLFTLTNPDRLVVDISDAKLSVALPQVEANDMITKLRTGVPKANVVRFVFELKQAVAVNSFLLSPNELYGHRLVVDVAPRYAEGLGLDTLEGEVPPTESVAQMVGGENMLSATQVGDTSASTTPPLRSNQFVVAIDAGHGGEDPGAIGHSGSKEKHITLAIANRLREIVEADQGMTARLIRTGDYFINLQQRRMMAREQGADVFVSIHADAFTKSSARGFSVFALSQSGATSAMARALADKENASDLIGGVSLADKDEVLAKVLVDLSMNNTISESVNLGGRVLQELSAIGHLHSKRVEQAGFMVLKSADMPSILIETGFITNPSEEARLRSAEFQQRVAQAIYTALYQYRQQTPYFANASYVAPSVDAVGADQSATIKHVVKRGDTLSEIADRYGTSVRAIMQSNGLRRDTAVLGQELQITTRNTAIPQNRAATSASVPSVHVVGRGDSLSKISAQYNIRLAALRRFNALKSDQLVIGQRIKLSESGHGAESQQFASNAGPAVHQVAEGDTLSEIALRYRVSVRTLKSLNNLSSNSIRVGQSIKLR